MEDWITVETDISHAKDPYWIAFSYVGEGPQEDPAQWVISVSYDAGLNLIKRLFHKPSPEAFAQLRDRLWQALKSNAGIKIVETQNG